MPEALVRRAAYDTAALKPIIFEMMNALGGAQIEGKRFVLIKPNFLLPAKPDSAITTHPLVLRVIAEYVLEKKARPLIADSPALGTFDRLMKHGGYREALSGLDVEFRAFSAYLKTDIGPPFGLINLAKEALEADFVINCAKLKTHTQMLLTLGVKNLFGCVVGLQKPEWHLRTGIDRDKFAQLLIQIHLRVAPAITLIDGILALEGDGPGKGGIPKHLGLLVGSTKAVWADAAVCRLLGISPQRLPTLAAAERLGLAFDPLTLSGDAVGTISLQLPELAPLTFGPILFQGFMRKHLVQRPVVEALQCKRCGECIAICPAKAISPTNSAVSFDYDRCIRCYCCVEICPHGALRAAETNLGKVMRNIVLRFSN